MRRVRRGDASCEYTLDENGRLALYRAFSGTGALVELRQYAYGGEAYVLPDMIAQAFDASGGEEGLNVEFQSTDGSEMMVFLMMGMLNDESALVEEYGALVLYMEEYDAEGNTSDMGITTMTETEIGKLIMVEYPEERISVYIFADCIMMIKGDTLSAGEYNLDFPFEDMWDNQLPIPGEDDMLFNIKDGEDGTLLLRTRPADGGAGEWYDYTTDDGMHIQRCDVYRGDENGETVPDWFVTVRQGEAVVLPEQVVEAYHEVCPTT